jgi:hypothetical protein
MPRIYKLSRTGQKILYKIRHHKGHGIHSPFVFDLITKVIEEKTPYHAYEDIRALIEPYTFLYLKKYNLLSFRLINYFNAGNILEIGSGYGINTICMTAPSSAAKCVSIETNEKKHSIARKLYGGRDRNIELHTSFRPADLKEKRDCIFLDLNNYISLPADIYKYLGNISHEKTFIIVKGIRTNRRNQALWRSIINMDGRTAVLDLFNIGIVFFDKSLYRWEYKISF